MFNPRKSTCVCVRFSWLFGVTVGAQGCFSKLDELKPAPVQTDESTTRDSTNGASTENATTTLTTNAETSAPHDGGLATTAESVDTFDAQSPSTLPDDTLSDDSLSDDTSPSTDRSSNTTLDADVITTSEVTTSSEAITSEQSSASEATSTGDSTTADTTGDDTPAFFTSKSGLLVWFDADHAASFDAETGSVQNWLDRSGNAIHLNQTATANRPLRVLAAVASRAVVRFDGTNDSLSATQTLSNRAFETLIVWQSAVAMNSVKASMLVNGRNFEINYSHTAAAAANATSVCVGANCINDSGWHNARFAPVPQTQVAYLWNPVFAETGTDLLARVWGGATTPQTDPDDLPVVPNAPLLIGNCADDSCPFNGDIAEVLVFDRALSTSERAEAETYLATKWALTTP